MLTMDSVLANQTSQVCSAANAGMHSMGFPAANSPVSVINMGQLTSIAMLLMAHVPAKLAIGEPNVMNAVSTFKR